MEIVHSITKRIYSKKIIELKASRMLAVQCLYSIEHDTEFEKNVDQKLAEIISIYENELKNSKLSQANQSHLIKTVRHCVLNKTEIESQIIPHLSKNWRINRLPKLIYCILLCAVSELTSTDLLRKKIIINDYLEIAKLFNHISETTFINSILDKIAFPKDL